MTATIEFDCPRCGQHLEAGRDLAGKWVVCPSCKRKMRVPSARQRDTVFHYRGWDARRGQETTGRIKAPSREEAVRRIGESGISPRYVSGMEAPRAIRGYPEMADIGKRRSIPGMPGPVERVVVAVIVLTFAAMAYYVYVVAPPQTGGGAGGGAPTVQVVSIVDGLIPDVVSFSDWKCADFGVQGTMFFSGWGAMPGARGASLLMNFKAYDAAGTVISSGPVFGSTLNPGESGLVKITGVGVQNAERIVVTIR